MQVAAVDNQRSPMIRKSVISGRNPSVSDEMRFQSVSTILIVHFGLASSSGLSGKVASSAPLNANLLYRTNSIKDVPHLPFPHHPSR